MLRDVSSCPNPIVGTTCGFWAPMGNSRGKKQPQLNAAEKLSNQEDSLSLTHSIVLKKVRKPPLSLSEARFTDSSKIPSL
ncbi:hypothetical protein F0562_006289 [Nyssa sinensis]|uniref:Uncharacterized protein n=1 Tax=Nyssa sinensis TaxID=561372 RepID=A0A5J5ALH1_9ASTE|nr:hypothetical protein F0562_006289 [Nyssa sinensis]